MMTPEQFCYWLQGYSEVSGRRPSAEEWQVIRDHLAEVFDKVTPPKGGAGGDGKPRVLKEEDFKKLLETMPPGMNCSLADHPIVDAWAETRRYCGSAGPGKIC